jgi:SPP1 gp7 family putative phage head morphogenesis protein
MTKKQIETLYNQLSEELEATLNSFEGKKITPAKKIKALELEIKKSVDKTYGKLSTKMIKDLEILSDKSYLKGLINVKKTSTIKEEAQKLANLITNRKVAGKTITKRLFINFEKIKKDCLKIVKSGLGKGQSYKQMASEISKTLNIDKRRALRIAWTEGHRIKEEATRRGFDRSRALGNEFDIEWMATKDSRTRPSHVALDGKKADKDGYFYSGEYKTKYPGGFGVAKEDIHCRCTIVAVDIEGLDLETLFGV